MTEKQRPTYTAYTVTGQPGAKGVWREIGAAWANQDGKGLTLHLYCLPLDGHVVLRQTEGRFA